MKIKKILIPSMLLATTIGISSCALNNDNNTEMNYGDKVSSISLKIAPNYNYENIKEVEVNNKMNIYDLITTIRGYDIPDFLLCTGLNFYPYTNLSKNDDNYGDSWTGHATIKKNGVDYELNSYFIQKHGTYYKENITKDITNNKESISKYYINEGEYLLDIAVYNNEGDSFSVNKSFSNRAEYSDYLFNNIELTDGRITTYNDLRNNMNIYNGTDESEKDYGYQYGITVLKDEYHKKLIDAGLYEVNYELYSNYIVLNKTSYFDIDRLVYYCEASGMDFNETIDSILETYDKSSKIITSNYLDEYPGDNGEIWTDYYTKRKYVKKEKYVLDYKTLRYPSHYDWESKTEIVEEDKGYNWISYVAGYIEESDTVTQYYKLNGIDSSKENIYYHNKSLIHSSDISKLDSLKNDLVKLAEKNSVIKSVLS